MTLNLDKTLRQFITENAKGKQFAHAVRGEINGRPYVLAVAFDGHVRPVMELLSKEANVLANIDYDQGR